MLRNYLRQMRTLVSLAEKMGMIMDPYNHYDVRLNSRLAGIVNEITKDKVARKKK